MRATKVLKGVVAKQWVFVVVQVLSATVNLEHRRGMRRLQPESQRQAAPRRRSAKRSWTSLASNVSVSCMHARTHTLWQLLTGVVVRGALAEGGVHDKLPAEGAVRALFVDELLRMLHCFAFAAQQLELNWLPTALASPGIPFAWQHVHKRNIHKVHLRSREPSPATCPQGMMVATAEPRRSSPLA